MRCGTILLAVAIFGCAIGYKSFPMSESPVHPLGDCDPAPTATPPRPRDVVIAIDASRSAIDPSDADVNSNGVVGVPRFGEFGLAANAGSTESGDNFLAAQVAAARSLIRGLSGDQFRFALVAFGGRIGKGPLVETALITNAPPFDAAFDPAFETIAKRQPSGPSGFLGGMFFSMDAITSSPDPNRSPDRVVLFISDSPGPSPGVKQEKAAVKEAAQYALELGIIFHTFGLGQARVADPPSPLSEIASSTRGSYHPVVDPNQLHCQLYRALQE